MDYYLVKGLQERKKELRSIVKEKQDAIKKTPVGNLRCKQKGRHFEYYWASPGSKKYSYIASKNIKFAKALAQRCYDECILRRAKRELKLIEMLLKHCKLNDLDEVYNDYPPGRKQLIHPLQPSDEEFLEEWNKQECCLGKFDENDPEFYTAKGERVRSKSEVFIANAMYFRNVPYLFETRLYLIGYGNVLPDFAVLDVRTRKTIIWEHLGKMGDPAYVERNLRKINGYLRTGYVIGETLILTFESEQQPLNTVFIENTIAHYFL